MGKFSDIDVEQRPPPVPDKPVLTSSSITAWQRCHEMWRLQYEQGYRTRRESFDLSFGTIIHNALEAWIDGDRDLLAAETVIMQSDLRDFNLARAVAMINGYHQRWAKDDEYTFVGAEMEFAIERPRYILRGKLDAMVHRRGKPMVMEHKTTSQPFGVDSLYAWKLDLDLQVGNYIEGAKELGFHETDTCVYDVLGKPKLKPGKVKALQHNGEDDDDYKRRLVARAPGPERPSEYTRRILADMDADPDKYFHRHRVYRQPIDVEKNRRTVDQVAAEMEARPRGGELALTSAGCTAYHRKCDYGPVCKHESDLDNDELFRRAESAHEELSQPKEKVTA